MKDRIKEIRQSQKLTQIKFAEDTGVSLSNIKSYELGRRNPSEAFIQLLCNKYRVNEAWLKDGVGEMYKPMDREAEIAHITAQLFKADEGDFRYKLQKLVSEMSDEEIELLRTIAIKLSEGEI